MKRQSVFAIVLVFILSSFVIATERDGERFSTVYTGQNLERVAFPIGGLGAGMFCLEGAGAISHLSVKNQMEFNFEPQCYAAICVLGKTTEENIARVVEGPVPKWKYFGKQWAANGLGGASYGLPRFRECSFRFRFPFAEIRLTDPKLPLKATITGWSPFTPPDADASGLPVGALEYTFENPTVETQRCVFSFNSRNFANERNKAGVGSGYQGHGSIGPVDGGFVLYDRVDEGREKHGSFAVFLDGEDAKNVVVDHCWFRGGWYDAYTIAWENVATGRMIDNPPVDKDASGATLAVPFELKPGETKTLRLLTCWYWPETRITAGRANQNAAIFLPASMPSRGTASGQQKVEGFLGSGLVNTFDPSGDGPQGSLTSPEFTLDKKLLHLLVGGGEGCSVKLFVDGKPVRSASGKNSERLDWVSWNIEEFKGKKGVIRIVDDQSGGWGHILCDHLILSDEAINVLKTGQGNDIVSDPGRISLIADFEGTDYAGWKTERRNVRAEPKDEYARCDCRDSNLVACFDGEAPKTYKPWYSTQFASIFEVADRWRSDYTDLKKRTELFTQAFYDSTLPPEIVETIASKLALLKTPTILRQHDGRLWGWEGCYDSGGCCHGTCTHVWTYTQAMCHLFPTLERSQRQTEYFESSWMGTGRQAFRANLPITPGGEGYDAADGQFGGVMKVYRDWRIFGNDDWLKLYWPRVRKSLDYMIETFDPRRTGTPEETHHNTYDINYFGPDSQCGTYYLGALIAAIEMGAYLKEDVSEYKTLLEKGRKSLGEDLFNGEYFVQEIRTSGLRNNFAPINPQDQSVAYREIAEAINKQGPKYQYGSGCLSDGVLGAWIALCCGLEGDTVPAELIEKHLVSVHKYNLKKDLSEHANPQRPSYAIGDDGGLLLCTWPHGGKPILPFVYSDEVWTGIEYQVAAHLLRFGRVDECLDILRCVRGRYDGFKRNPFDEYEWGHFYIRALSCYGMLQSLTGARYDAVTKTLYVDSKIGDFRSFLSTATGFGTVVFKGGEASLKVVSGSIDVQNIVVKK